MKFTIRDLFLVTVIVALGWLGAIAEETPKPAVVKEPKLRSELLARTKGDQEARKTFIAWMSAHGGTLMTAALSKEEQAEFEKLSGRLKAIDEENTNWLHEVVEKHGWPTPSLAGEDGASAAWLLVQHADADPKFQRKCLDLMVRLPKGDVSLSNLAYLTDRVLLAEGKKQLYGTQFTSVDGKWQPRPLEDEANVDQRRASRPAPTSRIRQTDRTGIRPQPQEVNHILREEPQPRRTSPTKYSLRSLT